MQMIRPTTFIVFSFPPGFLSQLTTIPSALDSARRNSAPFSWFSLAAWSVSGHGTRAPAKPILFRLFLHRIVVEEGIANRKCPANLDPCFGQSHPFSKATFGP